MAKRPSLADSLMASLNKGVHVDTAEKIARGMAPILDDEATYPPLLSQSVEVSEPFIEPVVLIGTGPIDIVEPVISEVKVSISDTTIESVSVLPVSRAIEQTNKHSDRQSNSHTTGIANSQANDQANKQADRQTTTEASKQAIEQTYQQDSRQPDRQSDNQTNEQSFEQSTTQTLEQPFQQTIRHSAEQSFKQSPKHAWLPLNENQGRILVFLYERGNGLTNMDIVCAETGIAYGTARTSIDILMKEGYVTSKTRHNGHAFRGFEYALNNHLCSLYISRIRGEQSSEQSSWQSIRQSSKQPNNQTLGQANKQTNGSFSSSFLEEDKPTTDLLRDPELRFWAGENVTEKQIQTWMAEFQMTQEEMIMSLRYGRFDILERGDVQNSANWFYKILTRNGFYPKPANYRSLLEIKAEALQQQQERDREAKSKIEAAEFDTQFDSFLSDPSAPLYQELLDKVGGFAKEQLKDGERMAADIELRELFKSYLQGS